MYDVISITDSREDILESFHISVIPASDCPITDHMSLYNEAVFASGKATIKPIEDKFREIRDMLLADINRQDTDYSSANKSDKEKFKFNPISFWRNRKFKELEDLIKDIFGYRSVSIEPYVEKWKSDKKIFTSKEINCYTWMNDRYPIDGLVTDNGFYDKTHSINLSITVSLGLIKILNPDEIVAIMLHELGHNIDPAMVSISYAETNIISKYLTERNTKLSKAEHKVFNDYNKKLLTASIAGMSVVTGVVDNISSIISRITSFISSRFNRTSGKPSIHTTDGTSRAGLSLFSVNNKFDKTLRKMIESDAKTIFNRKDFSEAFADNFARMYGYGPQLISAFKKFSKDNEDTLNTRFKKEKARQKMIMTIIQSSLKDEHKTDIHRAKALIAAYREDINDPNIPTEVKKQLQEDVEEVEKILDSYMNDFSAFQNRINKMISDEIDKNLKEYVEYGSDGYDYFDEASHGELKYAFRSAVDVKTNHELKIVYELEGMTIIMDPRFAHHKSYEKMKEAGCKTNEDRLKYLKTHGNTDFKSKGGKVVGIQDRDAGRQLKEAECTGIFGYNDSVTFKVKVGEIDNTASFKTTFFPRNSAVYKWKMDDEDGGITRNIGAVERIGSGRGAKLNDVNLGGSRIHPNKKTKKEEQKYILHRIPQWIERLEDDLDQLLWDIDYDKRQILKYENEIKEYRNTIKEIKANPDKYSCKGEITKYTAEDLIEQYNDWIKGNMDWISKTKAGISNSEDAVNRIKKELNYMKKNPEKVAEEEYNAQLQEMQAKINQFKTDFNARKRERKDIRRKEDDLARKLRNSQGVSDRLKQKKKEIYGRESYRFYEDFSRGIAAKQIEMFGNVLPIMSRDEYYESGLLFNTNPRLFTESRDAVEELKKRINAVTQEERNRFYKIFGKSQECSLAKDDDGYYVRTQRCRSGSYKSIESIPRKAVNFVRSTS